MLISFQELFNRIFTLWSGLAFFNNLSVLQRSCIKTKWGILHYR